MVSSLPVVGFIQPYASRELFVLNRYELLADKVRRDFPRFTVKKRDESWLRWIFWVLQHLTGQNYDSFTTTIFSTMYVGATWDRKPNDARYELLRHEKVHIEQFHNFPLGRKLWPVNHVLMSLCYLFVLPVFWTFRAKFERAGYTQSLLVQFELGGELTQKHMEHNAAWIAETFGGPAYFFMWRKKAAYAWAMETQRKINAGKIANHRDRVDALRVA